MWCELVRKKETGPTESQIEWKAKALPIIISFILHRSCLLGSQWRKTEFVKTSTFPVFISTPIKCQESHVVMKMMN